MKSTLSKTEKENLYKEAKAFYELAECGRKNIPEQKHVESYIPYIVNMSFCTELYLKLLLTEQGYTVKQLRTKDMGHHLHTLYKKLDPLLKDKIFQSFRRPMVYSIDEELQESDNAFPKWRYLVLDKANERQKNPNAPTFSSKPRFVDVMNDPDAAEIEQKKTIQFSPYFFKELNEILEAICGTYL